MRRVGMVIGIRPERIAEYKRLHAAIWPDVMAQIGRSNIRNFVIYLSSTLYDFGQVQVQNTLSVAMLWRAFSRGSTHPPISSMSSHFCRCDQ